MIEQGRARARASLGDTMFDAEWDAGIGLSLPESIDLASTLVATTPGRVSG